MIDNNGNILFEEKEKSNELQRTIFEGKHLLEETFDKEFYDQTMQEYCDLTLSQQIGNEEIDLFNQPLKMEELEGAIQTF